MGNYLNYFLTKMSAEDAAKLTMCHKTAESMKACAVLVAEKSCCMSHTTVTVPKDLNDDKKKKAATALLSTTVDGVMSVCMIAAPDAKMVGKALTNADTGITYDGAFKMKMDMVKTAAAALTSAFVAVASAVIVSQL